MQKQLSKARITEVTTSSNSWLAVCLIAVTLFAHSGQTHAQIVKHAVVLQPAPPAEQITADVIEARRKEVAESADLSDDLKKKADNQLKVASDGIKRISDLAATAAQFKSDTDVVQQRVSKLKQRLSALQALKPELPTLVTLPELDQERSL